MQNPCCLLSSHWVVSSAYTNPDESDYEAASCFIVFSAEVVET